MSILIRRGLKRDIKSIGLLDMEAFSGNHDADSAMLWVRSRMDDPTFRIWVAEYKGQFAGFVTWQIQGGWNRERPTTELERLAVLPAMRGKKVAQHLVSETLVPVGEWVRKTNKLSRHGLQTTITVWAGVDNPVNHIYRKHFPEVSGFRLQYSKPENLLRGTLVLP